MAVSRPMKATYVPIKPGAKAEELAITAVSAEVLAAFAARYSRTDEGIEAIRAKFAGKEEQSIEAIFNFADYGHASIKDLVNGVMIFIDGISMHLAFWLFHNLPVQAGQELSTRYNKLTEEDLIYPGFVDPGYASANYFLDGAKECFNWYKKATSIWERVFVLAPNSPPARIIAQQTDEKKKERMRKNFVFDRARYFLPTASLTNMVLSMSAREWERIARMLLSHPLDEFVQCGVMIVQQLEIACARSVKHATYDNSFAVGLAEEYLSLVAKANKSTLTSENIWSESQHTSIGVKVIQWVPNDFTPDEINVKLRHAFSNCKNRYGFIGDFAKHYLVNYSIDRVTFGEIRDLNRHRVGTKIFGGVPVGFYGAYDQLELCLQGMVGREIDMLQEELAELIQQAQAHTLKALGGLKQGMKEYMYYTLLGTQFSWSHATNLPHVAYLIWLRTGLGAQYKYAEHVSEVRDNLVACLPVLEDIIISGTAEPE